MLEQVAQRIAECVGRPPAHTRENAAAAEVRASPASQTHQIVSAVRTWTQHRVTGLEFPQRSAHCTRREQRRVCPDDHRRDVLTQQGAEGKVEARAKVRSALRENGPPGATAELQLPP